jgi:RNA polymerase sigma-70 factor, ECF subfamily
MTPAQENLLAVMRKVAARDRAAFAELYKVTSAKLYGIIVRILPARGIADEVMQEVYVKIWDRAGDFDPSRASPISWMAAIARNRALDEARKRTPVSIEEMPEGYEPPAEAGHPLDAQERNEALQALLACLSNLDKEKREIVLLAYYRGMSRDALARRYNHPVATIKTWLHRSLAQLRDCLGA